MDSECVSQREEDCVSHEGGEVMVHVRDENTTLLPERQTVFRLCPKQKDVQTFECFLHNTLPERVIAAVGEAGGYYQTYILKKIYREWEPGMAFSAHLPCLACAKSQLNVITRVAM